MESWMVLGLLALVVAELLCCFWKIFFQLYQQKREREALHFLNELQQCTDPNLIDPVTIDNMEERGDIIS